MTTCFKAIFFQKILGLTERNIYETYKIISVLKKKLEILCFPKMHAIFRNTKQLTIRKYKFRIKKRKKTK